MSDLDELASVQRGAPHPNAQPEPRPAIEGSGTGMRPAVWVAMIGGIAVVLGVAAWIIVRNTGGPAEPAGQASGTVATGGPSTRARPTTAATRPAEAAARRPRGPSTANTRVQPARTSPTTRPVAAKGKSQRRVLEDIADPLLALEIYHLKRGTGDTIEIKARNKSKRGLFVKSVELFAETNDAIPLDNIGFWLPAGNSVAAQREVPDLSRRLGPDERVKAVINQAEFRDEAPPELADQGDGLQ